MKEKLEQIREQAQQVIDTVKDLKGLEEIRVAYLGKKGEMTGVLRGMKELSAEERPVIGQVANEVRSQIEARLEERRKMLGSIAMEAKLEREKLDVTMPGTGRSPEYLYRYGIQRGGRSGSGVPVL